MRPEVQLFNCERCACVKRSEWPRSRSVSAPSSVTNTSPCWDGDIVPGSTVRYGSSLMRVTLRPRDSRIAARDAEAMPLPREDTTPPVTKTNLVIAIDTRHKCRGGNRNYIDASNAPPGQIRKHLREACFWTSIALFA